MGRRGAPEDFVTCDFTGTLVLADELATSDISGKRYRQEQQEQDCHGNTVYSSGFVRCSRTKSFSREAPFTRPTSAVSDVSNQLHSLGRIR
jgi:hypothetical protein